MKNELIEYLKTAGITLLMITVFIGFIVFDVAKSSQNRMVSIIERISSRLQTENIQELLEKEKRNPENFMANIKLAGIYEELDDNSKAEEQYKKALEKAPRNETVLYKYAKFCAKMGKFDKAIFLIEGIPDSPEKSTIVKKFSLYEYLGDKIFEIGGYHNAVKIYTIAYRYGKLLNNEKTDEIKKKMAKATIKLTEGYVAEYNSEQAILTLESLLKIENNPEAKYHLALIYKPTEPKKSAKLIDDLMTEAPELINFELYYSIMQDLINNAELEDNRADINYYRHKSERMKRFVIKNVIFANEFKIENVGFGKKQIALGKRILDFDIKNLTNNPINNLILKVNIKFPNSRKIKKELMVSFPAPENEKEPQVADVHVLIEGWEFLNGMIDKGDKVKQGEPVVVEVFAKKNNRFDWVLLGTFKVPMQ